MSRRPPVYTFRRPKKKSQPPFPIAEPQREMYTVLDDSESELDQISRYTRYSFFVNLTLLILFILVCVYISQRGLPARVRA